ncbi:MAG TPA: sigma-70 family RNA polymerase sigma factor [Blastocatellia bacterium]|nr:sigma-70 family RNA polymerase sigma factor [Blastocatellia bacterium]
MPRDNEEFAVIFNEVYPNLCRFLECLLGGEAAAQDIAQESFMRLHRADGVPADEARFWLYRVARNLALNELNKRQTRTRLIEKVADVFRRREPNPEEMLEQTERRKLLSELLKGLTEGQRAALLLREQEEMSYSEIARVLNVTESKVKVDIFRARANLRARWAKLEEG